MTERLAGKVAIITGGAGGIGAATAQLFCSQGASVVLVDRNLEALAETKADICAQAPASRIEPMSCDVIEADQVSAIVERTVGAFGGIDILVNNAAIRTIGPVATADTTKWQELMSVNLIGAVNFCKAAAQELRRRRGASIINVSSCYAAKGRADFGAYDATKAALLSLTRTLAFEESKHRIRVNAVCPGGTLTPFTVGRHNAQGIDEDQMRRATKPDTLLNRWAEAIEIAYPILWLASDEASFVTGTTLMVDGGCSIM